MFPRQTDCFIYICEHHTERSYRRLREKMGLELLRDVMFEAVNLTRRVEFSPSAVERLLGREYVRFRGHFSQHKDAT